MRLRVEQKVMLMLMKQITIRRKREDDGIRRGRQGVTIWDKRKEYRRQGGRWQGGLQGGWWVGQAFEGTPWIIFLSVFYFCALPHPHPYSYLCLQSYHLANLFFDQLFYFSISTYVFADPLMNIYSHSLILYSVLPWNKRRMKKAQCL